MHRRIRTLDAPHRLAGQRVDFQDVRRIVRLHPVQHRHIERIALQQRRRRVSPVQPELAVVGLDVARPDLLAREIKRLQHAEARHHPHVLAVGDRRRRRHVLFALHVIGVGELALPADRLLVAIDRPQLHHTGVRTRGDVEKDRLAPDDRRRSAIRRQRQLPRDVLGLDVCAHRGHQWPAFEVAAGGALRPLRRCHVVRRRGTALDDVGSDGCGWGTFRAPGIRQPRLGADAVVGRPPPVRPMLGHPGGPKRGQQGHQRKHDRITITLLGSIVPADGTGRAPARVLQSTTDRV